MMPDTITLFECPECGRPGVGRHYPPRECGHFCPGVPVERVYTANDALLDDATVIAAQKAYDRGMREAIRAAIAAVPGNSA